jgi:hypothetical protein
MVISYKLIERAMGNRGSKSDFNINMISVKEQRVDGSWCRGAKPYAIKVYSNRDKNLFSLSHNLPNQIRTNKQLRFFSTITNEKEKYLARFYSTSSAIKSNFNSLFITGLTDAEGFFVCIVRKSAGHRLGWRVEGRYAPQIGLHKKDL